ncbi:Caspase-7 [Blomia tropicalis]|nr:Caspase-7 [Blomia tropicalis]
MKLAGGDGRKSVSTDSEQTDSLWIRSNKDSSKSVSITIPNRNEFYYPQQYGKMKCLILNYEEFTNRQPTRHGTQLDADTLDKTFKDFGFECTTWNNLTLSETKKVLDDATKSNLNNFDGLILCLLSHGDKDEISCKDQWISIESIRNRFKSDRCPSLAGKPKLFFIQACRGTLFDSGTLVHDSLSSSLIRNDSRTFLIPTNADFLLFFSTYEGYYSFRNPSSGSWFIQDLCQVLKEYRNQYDLMTMCTIVCQRIAFERQSKSTDKFRNRKKQMPCIMSTLTRLVLISKTTTDL